MEHNKNVNYTVVGIRTALFSFDYFKGKRVMKDFSFLVKSERYEKPWWCSEKDFITSEMPNNFKQTLLNFGVRTDHWCDFEKEMLVTIAGGTALIATKTDVNHKPQINRLLFAQINPHKIVNLNEEDRELLLRPIKQLPKKVSYQKILFEQCKIFWKETLQKEMERVAMKSELPIYENENDDNDDDDEFANQNNEMHPQHLEIFRKVTSCMKKETEKLKTQKPNQPTPRPFVPSKEMLIECLRKDEHLSLLTNCEEFLDMLLAYQMPTKKGGWLLKYYEMHQSHLKKATGKTGKKGKNTISTLEEIFDRSFLPADEWQMTESMLQVALKKHCQICRWLFYALEAIFGKASKPVNMSSSASSSSCSSSAAAAAAAVNVLPEFKLKRARSEAGDVVASGKRRMLGTHDMEMPARSSSGPVTGAGGKMPLLPRPKVCRAPKKKGAQQAAGYSSAFSSSIKALTNCTIM